MARCPDGHESTTTDYCSICGTPMGARAQPAGAQVPVPSASAPAPTTQICPVCHSLASTDAFFCETCGYDFLTGSLPRGMSRPDVDEAAEVVVEPGGADPAEAQPDPDLGSDQREEQAPEAARGSDEPDAPAEQAPAVVTTFMLDELPGPAAHENPLVVEAVPAEPLQPPARRGDELSLGAPERDVPDPDDLRPIAVPARPGLAEQQPPEHEMSRPVPAQPPVAPAAGQGWPSPPRQPEIPGAGRVAPVIAGAPVPPSKAAPARWVAEIWIDPEWYRVQQAPEQLPSPGQPVIRALRTSSVVIGRNSPSGRPDLDCGSDTGVSRRQAVLSTDGIRWFVEDLGSSNGTYVGQVDQPMPTQAITGRVELGQHDRIYVGSWTRIVVRPALVQESDL